MTEGADLLASSRNPDSRLMIIPGARRSIRDSVCEREPVCVTPSSGESHRSMGAVVPNPTEERTTMSNDPNAANTKIRARISADWSHRQTRCRRRRFRPNRGTPRR